MNTYFRNLTLYFVTILLLVSYSCEFQPSEIPETFVEQPSEDGPVLTIEVNPNMDTLRLASDVLTEFRLSSSERNAEWVRIYFDETLVFDDKYSSSNLPQFMVEHKSYSEGHHRFKIQAFISTNTGSIADQLGTENYFYEMVWPVFIKHNVNVVVKNVQYRNGVAEIDWVKYDFYGFQNYTLSKESNLEGNQFEVEIYNPYITKVFDSTYIEGEIATYGIKLNENFTKKYEFQVPIESPDLSLNKQNELQIEWKKSQNPNHWESYYISSKNTLNGVVEEKRIYSADSTFVIFKKIGFGKPYEFQVRYIPKTFEGKYLNFESSGGLTKFSLGEKMSNFEYGFALPEINYLLLFKSVNYKQRFYKFNISTNQIEDSIQVDGFVVNKSMISISPKGKFFGYYLDGNFVLHQTSDLKMVNQIKVPFLTYGNLYITSSSISEDKKLVVVDHYGTLKIIDIVTGSEIYRKTSNSGNVFRFAKVNSTSNRILMLRMEDGKSHITLNSYENDIFKELGEVVTNIEFFNQRIGFGNENVVIVHEPKSRKHLAEIRNIDNFSIENSVELPYEYEPKVVDFTNAKVISKYRYSSNYEFSFFTDIQNEIIIKILPVEGRYEFVFSNDIIYSGFGSFISVDELLIHD